MLKVCVFDRDKMYKDDYPGSEEYFADEIHTDINGFLRFIELNEHRDLSFNMEYFFIDIYPAEVNPDA